MKTQSEIQKENVAELLNLIKENPDLPIVPMVDNEIVASDEHTNWLGSFGKAEIDYVWDNGERIYFKSNDEEYLLEKEFDLIYDEIFSNNVEPDPAIINQMATTRVNEYEWEKSIVVYIGLP